MLLKEFIVCETISCYTVLKSPEIDEMEKIILVCGTTENSKESSTLFVIRYETKKNKFF